MSEEKLYAVKNDKGEWLSFDSSHKSVWDTNNPTFFKDKIYAADQIMGHRARVVELVEAQAKVVLTKEQAKIVEEAHEATWPAYYITQHAFSYDDEKLLMNAYINGYTVETENKYNLILGTGTDGDTNALFKSNPCTNAALLLDTDTYADDLKRDKFYQFTQEEIDKYNKDFWIKNIDLNDYKVEVPIDD